MLRTTCPVRRRAVLSAIAIASMASPSATAQPNVPIDAATVAAARAALVAAHGEREVDRIDRGLTQVRAMWRPEDGDAAAFRDFVEAEFIPAGDTLDLTFERLAFALERIDGYMTSLSRDLLRGAQLEIGPLLPIDYRLASFSPAAHLSDDYFTSKLAFVALLNFPRTTLEEKIAGGGAWSRREWAETRLAGRFNDRVPADVNQGIDEAYAAANAYIAGYNIFLHHLADDAGERLFPPDLRLISHWGLRDEIKAQYSEPDGLARQRIIARVMDRIVRQEIPAGVIDDPRFDWNPATNAVSLSDATTPAELAAAGVAPGARAPADLSAREMDERYRQWLSIFRTSRRADEYSPDSSTFIDRRFDDDREIPEAEVRALLEDVLESPLGADVAALVARRLGRPLEPFDVWYAGFKPRGSHPEAELDARTRARYPTADAFAADLPRLLRDIGFSADRSRFLVDRIVVEPSRGAGHAFGPARRDDNAHLRTRVGAGGMDYKGYNIAVHELGHNVEQVFSVSAIDHTLLQGVPNTAFTEALAFLFQGRDLELLGLVEPDDESLDLAALDAFWSTREIAGVALVDMTAWRWLYDNPNATPAQFRDAAVGIAQDVWNRYYADLFGARDQTLLAVYSHMVSSGLYTPDYPLGYLIASQVEAHFRESDRPFGEEFERVALLGRLTPDAWMRAAVGASLSAAPMLDAAAQAISRPGDR